MRINLLIMMLLSDQIYGKFTFENIEEVQRTTRVGSSKKEMEVNLNGPLNLLRGYIYEQEGYMANKRLFSPDIVANFLLEPISVPDAFWPNFKMTVSRAKDTHWKTKHSSDPIEVHKRVFNKILISAFPSSDGDYSIEAMRDDSFFRFIQNEAVKPHMPRIMAALFLLSEGIDVPIFFTQERKDFCLIMNVTKEICLNIPMRVSFLNSKTNELVHREQTEARDLIQFFKDCCTMPYLYDVFGIDEPNTLEEFKSGEFLNSIKFFIQVYIFKLVNTVKEAQSIIVAVYEMLEYCINEENHILGDENQKRASEVLKRCFSPASQVKKENISYFDSIKEVKACIDKYNTFPFVHAKQLPEFKSIPKYSRTNKEFFPKRNCFRNCVENSLYILFCCFSYSPETQSHTIDHIRDPSPDLKAFFANNKLLMEDMDLNLHMEWSKVVSDLSCPEISYKEGGHNIRAGLLNMLCILLQISGYYEKLKDEHLGYFTQINRNAPIGSQLRRDIQQYTEKVFTLLSNNKNISVLFEDFIVDYRTDDKVDVFGTISIKYSVNEINCGIQLYLKSGHAKISLLPQNRADTISLPSSLQSLENMHKRENCFIGHLVSRYIRSSITCINEDAMSESVPKDVIRELSYTDFHSMNALLMAGKIQSINYKKNLIHCLVAYTIEKKIDAEHPVARFIHNILGSVLLSNYCTQLNMLSSVIYNGSYKKCFPSVKIPESLYLKIGVYNATENKNIFSHILERGDPEILLMALDTFIKLEKSYGSANVPFLSKELMEPMFDCIFKDGNTMRAEKLLCLIEKYWYNKTYVAGLLRFIWLIYACEKMDIKYEVIRYLYTRIIPLDLQLEHIGYLSDRKNFKKVISTLNTMKNGMCLEKDFQKLDMLLCFFEKVDSILCAQEY
ncbi:hypothetical protein NEPAR06_0726 [Nematocida parisii]|nr:hypothetical protein NEPAR06_0726 [Nematocida parisii]